RAIGGLAEPRRDPDLVAVLERLAEAQDRLAAEPRHDPALPAVLERLAAGQERLAVLAEAPAQPGFDGAVLGEALERLAEGQARLATLAEAPAPEDGRLARALERLAEGQERILDLGAQRPAAAAAAAGDDPEARMRLRSIDVQLGRLVEETASGRDGLIAELRSDLAALTRAIRNLERGDGT
ncbi:hypothetical protein DVR11_19745, partial [Paracoccus versutus]